MSNSKINIRQIALPTEHGSWGFVLEPLVLALLVAYSFPGLMIALCTFFMFLSHQPIKIIFKKNNRKSYNKIVIIVLCIYFLFITAFFSITFFNVALVKLIPFGLSLIVMANYLANLYKQKNRELISELSAPISISLIALCIVLFKGWQIEYVIAFWIILLARSIPTTFYVHTKLLLFKKKESKNTLPLISVYIFTGILLWTSMLGFTPYLTVAASLILLARTHLGIFYSKGNFKVVKFGIIEFVYGGLYILVTAFGYIYSI